MSNSRCLIQAMIIATRRHRIRKAEQIVNHSVKHQHDHCEAHHPFDKASQYNLAHSATFHCLMGCGIGEVGGVIIGVAFGLSNLTTLALAVVLGISCKLIIPDRQVKLVRLCAVLR